MRTTSHLALAAVCCLALAACDDVDPQQADSTGDPASELTVTGTDELLWRPPELTVTAGAVDVRVDCGHQVGHEFAIDGIDGGTPVAACERAGTGTGSVDLEPGSYTFFCAVPGHREEGMEGELLVQ